MQKIGGSLTYQEVRRIRFKQPSILILILLVSATALLQESTAQTITSPSLQDKALSFLSDIVQLDMTKYKVTLNNQFTEDEHISLTLDAVDTSILDNYLIRVNANLNFHNGTLTSCNLSPGLGGLAYAYPESDRFNATLRFMQRYYNWTNDSQVEEMILLLQKVGAEKNATETLGNLTLNILVRDMSATYNFYRTFNGVKYSGINLNLGNRLSSFYFVDYRVYQKIGDTSINVSKEQAIQIAKDFLKTYTVNSTFANGTTIYVSDLNVAGVNSASLQTSVKENSTLYPLWNVQLDVSNMPKSGLQGVGVWIWANDASIRGAYNYAKPLNFDPLNFFFFPIFTQVILSAFFVIGSVIAVIIVLIVVLTKQKPNTIQVRC